MYFINNNVVSFVFGDYLIVGEISMKKCEKPTFYGVYHVTSAEERLSHRIFGGKHVTNPRETNFDESESDTWTS
jgi:hypothetical protein